LVSILDRNPHLADVYPQVRSTDDLGNPVWVPAESPIRIRCAIQPSTSNEVSVTGQYVVDLYRLIAREAPLGPWAAVWWVDEGSWWDVQGAPRHYRMSGRTRHVDAMIRRRRSSVEVA
jgi:hypothetical protein